MISLSDNCISLIYKKYPLPSSNAFTILLLSKKIKFKHSDRTSIFKGKKIKIKKKKKKKRKRNKKRKRKRKRKKKHNKNPTCRLINLK